jgi:hypothetical protein
MDNEGNLLLLKSFYRLSGEKQAEILGMVKALIFAQSGEDKGAPDLVTAVHRSRGRSGKGKRAESNG